MVPEAFVTHKCVTEGKGQEGNVAAKKHFLPNLLLFEDLSTLDQILVNLLTSVRPVFYLFYQSCSIMHMSMDFLLIFKSSS